MKAILRNTTALAACLSLILPHAALAQTAPEPAAGEAAPTATPLPQTPPEAVAEEPAPEAAPAPPEPTPEVKAEAPAPATPEAAAQEPVPEAAPSPTAETPPAAATEAPVTQASPEVASPPPEPAPEVKTEETAPATTETPAQEPAPDAVPSTAAETKPEAAAEDPVNKATPEATPTPTEPAPEAKAEEPATEAPEQDPAPDTAPSTAAETKPEATAEDPVNKATPEAAPTPPEPAPEVQAEEPPPAAGVTTASPSVEAPEAQPAAEAPETGAAETAAAQEAATATEAPKVEALEADAPPSGQVREETITQENSRSSDQDFATRLRDGLQEAVKDRDTETDLAKALLLGLGAVAVGSYLSNNNQVTLATPDRVVVTRDDGSQQLIKDETALLRRPGAHVTTEDFADGSSRTIVRRPDGSQVVTLRDANLRVLRRSVIDPRGREQMLIDDTQRVEPIDIATLPAPARPQPAPVARPTADSLRQALMAQAPVSRSFTLAQVRDIAQVRALVAPVNIDAITFDTGSAAIKPDQARQLADLGQVIADLIAQNPAEIFLIEGHTDSVGSDAANLALSDRRAESVALALTEYFAVPPENLVVQGYGEQFLLIRQQGDIRENRRASVRRITTLLGL